MPTVSVSQKGSTASVLGSYGMFCSCGTQTQKMCAYVCVLPLAYYQSAQIMLFTNKLLYINQHTSVIFVRNKIYTYMNGHIRVLSIPTATSQEPQVKRGT